jgi:hypothetical protein
MGAEVPIHPILSYLIDLIIFEIEFNLLILSLIFMHICHYLCLLLLLLDLFFLSPTLMISKLNISILQDFHPQANYTDRTTAACRRS